jgi:hypothetical protein
MRIAETFDEAVQRLSGEPVRPGALDFARGLPRQARQVEAAALGDPVQIRIALRHVDLQPLEVRTPGGGIVGRDVGRG